MQTYYNKFLANLPIQRSYYRKAQHLTKQLYAPYNVVCCEEMISQIKIYMAEHEVDVATAKSLFYY